MAVAEQVANASRRCSTARLRTDRATRILTTDATFGALMGRDPSALAGEALAVFVPIDQQEGFRSRVALLPAGGRIDEWRLQLSTPGGVVHVSARVLAGHEVDEGDALDWMLVCDPEDGTVAARPTNMSAMTLSEVAGLLGHELNQPLAAIVSYARGAMLRVRAGTLSPEDLEGVLSIIVAEAMRVADRLRQLAARDERGT